MPVIDLAFELRGESILLDHGYALFSALSRIVPGLHGDRRIGVHPIRGLRTSPRRWTLVPQSKLRLRLPAEEIGNFLGLVGARLDIEGDVVGIGIPRIEPLQPRPSLASRIVAIGHYLEPDEALASVGRQLVAMGVSAEPRLIAETNPDFAGRPIRRVFRVKGRRLVGFAIRVDGLNAEESLTLQEHGLGGRRRMGCGIFTGVVDRGPRALVNRTGEIDRE